MKRLQLQGDLHAQLRRIVAQQPAVLDARPPLLLGRNHFLVPDVFAQHQQHVLGLVLVGQVEILLHALDMKPLHAGIEVDQPHRHAGDRDDRQLQPVALVLDQPPLADVDIERIDEDIDRVEAELLGLPQAIDRRLIGLHPGGVDEAEFHGRARAEVRVQGSVQVSRSKFQVDGSTRMTT